MHIHIVGIGGTFMGGIAILARQAGHRVSGCDMNIYPPMSDQLAQQDIELITGYDAKQIEIGADQYIIGNALSRGNPLVEAILDHNLSYISGPQWLYENILRDKWVLAVAGTHGKTTTTSMLTFLLDEMGLKPGFLIGGIAKNFGVSARLSQSKYFVVEADEYDTAFFDKRPKFIHYHPHTLILNNLEFDHADIFQDLAAIQTQFHYLVRTVPSQGRIIFNQEDAALKTVLDRGCWSHIEKFNDLSEWSISKNDNEKANKNDSLNTDKSNYSNLVSIHFKGQRLGKLNWQWQGQHNLSNMLAAIAAANHIGIDIKKGIKALENFAGVKRRMELLATIKGINVYDDFAHHPSAIETTIAGLRAILNNKNLPAIKAYEAFCNSAQSVNCITDNQTASRIIVLLEIRSNTMKLGVLKEKLIHALNDADLIFVYGHTEGKNAIRWNLAQALTPLGNRAQSFDQVDILLANLLIEIRSDDHIVVMSNGSFDGIHQKLIDKLKVF